MILSNRMYNGGKWVAQIGLPALGTLYFALSQIWGLPDGAEIVGSITALDTFLGVVLGLSSRQYNSSDEKYDGTMKVQLAPGGKKVYSLELNQDVTSIDGKNEVTFRVTPG